MGLIYEVENRSIESHDIENFTSKDVKLPPDTPIPVLHMRAT